MERERACRAVYYYSMQAHVCFRSFAVIISIFRVFLRIRLGTKRDGYLM